MSEDKYIKDMNEFELRSALLQIQEQSWAGFQEKINKLGKENKKLKEFGWKWCKDELPEHEWVGEVQVKGLTKATFRGNFKNRYGGYWMVNHEEKIVTQWLKAPEPMEENG